MEKSRKNILIGWLLLGLVMVLAMVVIGGITRLTHSGLSMVDWKLISGTIPPLNEVEWLSTFDKYKQFPEYQKMNMGMSLSEFKLIFFWEYLHRVFGRLIGLVFIFPYLFFVLKKWLNKDLNRKLFILLLLGALQGGIGWFMVKSGLVDRPSVSHFRLAIHLLAAFSVIVYIFWLVLGLLEVKRGKDSLISKLALGLLGVVILQITYGAFTAGLKAGLICPTFPDMCGKLVPATVNRLDFINDPTNIQFVHRCLAWVVFFFSFFVWKKVRESDLKNQAGNMIVISVCIQFCLGVATLLMLVPVSLGVIHQVGAVFVLLSVVNLVYRSRGKVS